MKSDCTARDTMAGARQIFRTVVLAASMAACVPGLAAAAYPDRPIRLVVTHPAGGALDASARQLAEKLPQRLGQPVVVESRVGAAGLVGTQVVAKSAADGYTLGFVSSSFTILPLLYPKMPFALADLTAVAKVVEAPFVIVAPPNLPQKTMREFLDAARRQPNTMTMATGGNGSFGHLLLAWLNAEANVAITHVPYKGEAPALTGLLANDANTLTLNITTALPLLKANRLRALAVTGEKRAAALPDVPAVNEHGVPTAVAPWFGVLAPTGTPAPIVARLNDVINQTLQDRDLRDRFLGQGFDIGNMTPGALQTAINREGAQWARIVKERNINFE